MQSWLIIIISWINLFADDSGFDGYAVEVFICQDVDGIGVWGNRQDMTCVQFWNGGDVFSGETIYDSGIDGIDANDVGTVLSDIT